MTKLTAKKKNAELPQVSYETLVSTSFGFGSGALVVCMCYYLDTYDYQTGYESFVSLVKVGNERLFKKYSQLPIPFI